MNKFVQNLNLMIAVRVGTYALIILSALKGLISGRWDSTAIIPIVIAAVVLLAFYLIVRPSYYALETAGGDLYISTSKEADNEYYLRLKKSEIVDYKFWGPWYKRKLLILKKEHGQYMISKPLKISLSSSKHLAEIKEMLDPFVQPHSIGEFKK